MKWKNPHYTPEKCVKTDIWARQKVEKEVKPLSNIFHNRLDDLIDSSIKEDIISRHQNRNAISSWLLAIEKNKVTNHFQIEERVIERNKVANHFE